LTVFSFRFYSAKPQNDVSKRQAQEEASQRQHDITALFLFCGGMFSLYFSCCGEALTISASLLHPALERLKKIA